MGNKVTRIADLVGHFNKLAPYDYAEDWDNVGFLAGNGDAEITGVVVAVNLGKEALAEAKAKGANVIVCHHPPIFKPITKLTNNSSPYLYEALTRGISVIALHTNFDLASEKMNREICAKLGAQYKSALANRGAEGNPLSIQQAKFITYVPHDAVDNVRQAIAKAGGGVIGNYTQCSFQLNGTGTFLGGEGSNPVVGTKGTLERAEETRLEMIFPWKLMDKVLAAARAAHPYEEMAFDVIKLENPARNTGYGFIGEFEGKIAFDQFLAIVKSLYQLQTVTIVRSEGVAENVKRIAFSPGSGSGFVNTAIMKGVDVYICGEVGYHHMLDAKRKEMALIVLGHSYSERFYVETVTQWSQDYLKKNESTATVSKVFEIVESHG